MRKQIKEQGSEQRFLTTEELGELLRRKPATLRAWRNTGVGPTWLKLAGVGTILYPSDEVEAYLAKSRRVSGLQERLEVACEGL